MLKKTFALAAISGMLFSPLALAQDPGTAGGVASGGTAFEGIAGALGVSTTVVAVGTGVIVTGIVIGASNSGSSSGTTGTN